MSEMKKRLRSRCHLRPYESREPVHLDDPAARRALATCLAMPYTGDPLIDERLDLIRALAVGLEMPEKAERAAMLELVARFDHAIAAAKENVYSLGERLLQLDAQARGRRHRSITFLRASCAPHNISVVRGICSGACIKWKNDVCNTVSAD